MWIEIVKCDQARIKPLRPQFHFIGGIARLTNQASRVIYTIAAIPLPLEVRPRMTKWEFAVIHRGQRFCFGDCFRGRFRLRIISRDSVFSEFLHPLSLSIRLSQNKGGRYSAARVSNRLSHQSTACLRARRCFFSSLEPFHSSSAASSATGFPNIRTGLVVS